MTDYTDFRKWDSTHQEPIMAEATTIMEAWFEKGVRYNTDPVLGGALGAVDIMVYTNPPLELQYSLKSARGRILENILQWHHVPDYLAAKLCMAASAIPPEPLGLRREVKAVFQQRSYPLPYGPVYWTRDRQPKERATLLSHMWYELETHHLYKFVSRAYTTQGDQWRPRTVGAIERLDDLTQRLRMLGLNQLERRIYYACRDFEYLEVAEFSSLFGRNTSAGAVRKFYERTRGKLV
jgi:hypothetical protein